MQSTADIKFAAGGKFIYAHKAVLKLSSKYFKGMFDNNWKENTATGKCCSNGQGFAGTTFLQ